LNQTSRSDPSEPKTPRSPAAPPKGREGTSGRPTPAGDGAGHPETGRSLIRTLRIIEHLARVPAPATLAALSAELELPKSSLLGLLRPLCRHGYVCLADGGYTLGPASFRLGISILPTLSLSRVAVPVMRRLVDRTGETALVAILDRESAQAVYVEKVESPQSIRYSASLGATRPLYCSAAGRVLLAFADDEFVEAFLRRAPYPALTPQTLTRGAELRAMLPHIREQKLAVTIGELSSDVAGFAAPIFDRRDRVVAALTMAAPVGRVGADRSELAHLVRDAANDISLALGHLPAPAAPRPTPPPAPERRRGRSAGAAS